MPEQARQPSNSDVPESIPVSKGTSCPRCGGLARLRYRWKPNASPTEIKFECDECGYSK